MTGLDEHIGDPNFMLSLARGLEVLRCFGSGADPLTIADISRATGISRPSVRRCLHTLTKLGYAAQQGSGFRLRPKTLTLGHAFLSSSPIVLRAQPRLDQLRSETGESCSLGVLEEDQLCYVARAQATRIMSITLGVGSRLPLYATSMGRVLLAGRPPEERAAYLKRVEPRPLTARTLVDPAAILDLLSRIAAQGYAIVDQELEIGLRSIAVPVFAVDGVVAAINIGTHAARASIDRLEREMLPALIRARDDIGHGSPLR